MVFAFEKFLIDNLKIYGLTDPINFLENVILDILKNVMPTVLFSVTTNPDLYFYICLSLYRRLLPLIKGDYSNLKHFKKCNGTVGSSIQKL